MDDPGDGSPEFNEQHGQEFNPVVVLHDVGSPFDSENEDNMTDSDESQYNDENISHGVPDVSIEHEQEEVNALLASSSIRNFDTNLPTEHSYLGNDLEYIRGRVVFEDYQIVRLPVMPGLFIVCPGYTLAITYFHHRDLIRSIISKDRTFGLTYEPDHEGGKIIGVTMEIYEYAENDREIKLKAKGRQRFRIVDEEHYRDAPIGVMQIQIMPEISLGPPLRDIQITSLNKCRLHVTDDESFKHNHQLRIRDAAQTTWPLWVFNSYDEYFLMSEITNLLQNFRDILPKDPVKLSYWVVQNFLLSTVERIYALRLNCATQRLQLVLDFMRAPRVLSCAQCQEDFASQKDLFPMSKDGLQNTYCNPGGIVHETITVLKVQKINLVGTPQTEYSWFPGYAWTIAQCRRCGHHIGWRFTAVADMKPYKFYGLTRTSVQIKILPRPNLTGNVSRVPL